MATSPTRVAAAATTNTTHTTATAFSTFSAPPSPVLPSTERAQTLQVILEFYMKELERLHQRMARVELAILTKGESMGMGAQATDFEAQDAARHTLASGATGTTVDDAAAVPQDGWRSVFAPAPLSTTVGGVCSPLLRSPLSADHPCVCVLRSHPEARLLRIKDSLAERQTAVMDNIVAISACYAPASERSSAERVHESGTVRSVRQRGEGDSSSSTGDLMASCFKFRACSPRPGARRTRSAHPAGRGDPAACPREPAPPAGAWLGPQAQLSMEQRTSSSSCFHFPNRSAQVGIFRQ
jgi:hypothetical protein